MAVDPRKTAQPASEEPDAETSPRTWILPVLLVMVSAAVAQGFVRFTFSYVLPGMTEDILGSYSVAGLFSAANLGGYLLGVTAVTSVSRRVEGTRLLKAGLALITACLSTVALAPWIPLLFLGMGLAGLCSAAVWIPIPAIVAAHVPRRHRGFAFGLATAGSGAGLALTGPMVTMVQQVFGADAWRPVWGLEAAISLVVLTLQLLFLRPGRTHPVDEERPRRRTPLRAILPGSHTLLIACFLYGVSFSLYTNYLVAALRENPGFAPETATGVFSLLGLASLFGGVLGGRVSDVCGRRGTLAVMMVLVGLLAAVIPMGWGGVLHLSAFAYGLLMMGIGAVLIAYLGDALGPGDIGVAFGVTTMSLGLSQLVAPPVGGWLADRTGSFDIVFHVSCGTGILAGVVVCFLPGTGRAFRRRRAARRASA